MALRRMGQVPAREGMEVTKWDSGSQRSSWRCVSCEVKTKEEDANIKRTKGGRLVKRNEAEDGG